MVPMPQQTVEPTTNHEGELPQLYESPAACEPSFLLGCFGILGKHALVRLFAASLDFLFGFKLIYLRLQSFRSVKNSARVLCAHEAALGLLRVFKCARLTKVVLTLCDNRRRSRVPRLAAYEACERQAVVDWLRQR